MTTTGNRLLHSSLQCYFGSIFSPIGNIFPNVRFPAQCLADQTYNHTMRLLTLVLISRKIAIVCDLICGGQDDDICPPVPLSRSGHASFATQEHKHTLSSTYFVVLITVCMWVEAKDSSSVSLSQCHIHSFQRSPELCLLDIY